MKAAPFRSVILLGLLLLSASASSQSRVVEASLFGRYVGTLRHDALGKEQLVKLDFISSFDNPGALKLMAILTLHFGDFTSGEYVNFHYENVQFNVQTQTFTFDHPDQGVSIVAAKLQGDTFEGEVRATFAGKVGTVRLKRNGTAAPVLPLIEPLWGQYTGNCETGEHELQLVTYRSNEDTGRLGNPYGTYKIKGELAWRSAVCLDEMCTLGKIGHGSYNFFRDDLRLVGNKSLLCKVEPDALMCNGCRYSRRTGASGPSRVLRPPESKGAFTAPKPAEGSDPALSGEIASIQGEYVGYVHHEYLNQYQLGSLSLRTFQGAGEPGATSLRMSAIATLYFGEQESAEFVPYRFPERVFPNPVTAPVFVFARPEGDVDAILQVTQIGKGMAKGTWYSLLFGRVGTFEFYKAGPPTLPAGAVLMRPLGGKYESEQWFMSLFMSPGTIPGHTENPFFPLVPAGTLSNSAVPLISVTSGTYDFYTGKVGLETGESVLAGRRETAKKLMLRAMTPSRAPTFPRPDTLLPFVYRGPMN